MFGLVIVASRRMRQSGSSATITSPAVSRVMEDPPTRTVLPCA
jgi:hypothetical protein